MDCEIHIQHADSFLDTDQAEASGCGCEPCLSHESLATVADLYYRAFQVARYFDRRFRGLRMLDDIVNCLLHDAVNTDFSFLRKCSVQIVDGDAEANRRRAGN